MPSKDYNIGHGITARFVNHALGCPARDNRGSGLILRHQHDDGSEHKMVVWWCRPCSRGALRIWTIATLEPLTIMPAIGDPYAKECPLFGHITKGRWVPGGAPPPA
jgi:hypothetical protein